MAEIINSSTRKAIKTMVHVSQCARALTLLPTPEDFAMRLIGDMRIVARRINSISIKINEILDRYSSIPSEFLFESLDEVMRTLDNVNDYTKSAIQGTSNILSSSLNGTQTMVNSLGYAVSSTTSATLQIGGGLTYDAIAMGSNLNLVMTGNNKREMTTYVTDWVENSYGNLSETIDNVVKTGNSGIESVVGSRSVDNAIKTTERYKREIEYRIERVRDTFDSLTKDFGDMFGFVNGSNFGDGITSNLRGETDYSQIKESFSDATGELSDAAINFVKNFNIGKVVGAIGGIVVGAGAATLAVDLLPKIDADRILKTVIGGVDIKRIENIIGYQYNKYYENAQDLFDIPDVPWKLSKDDLEKYDSSGYDKYIEDFEEENNKKRSEIFEKMQKARTLSDLSYVNKESKENTSDKKSALNTMRNVRRSAIKAKQIENYKHFLSVELNCLKKECLYMKDSIKNEWDLMMSQYKEAINEITRFFSADGFGGNETVDRCCDRINDDYNQILELCKAIPTEMANASAMAGVPYAVGMCCSFPVHHVLAFIKDLQIILTFVKELIRLGIDIITQLTIIAKLIFNGFQNLADLLKKLKKLIGVDKVLDMIDNVVGQVKPKMAEGKILSENSLTPIYYNETDDYDRRIKDIEKLFEDDSGGGYVEYFRYTDDPNARRKYRRRHYGGGYYDEDEIEDILEELEAKGEREIVAYRSPILNDEGDDFAGWIFYHADAYDDMKHSWRTRKKRRRNRVIYNASKKNKMKAGRLMGGVAALKKNQSFGKYINGEYKHNTVTAFDAYYWYTKYTNDPTDCNPDFDNVEYFEDENGNIIPNENFKNTIVTPIQTTSNGSLVELNDGRRVFVEGKIVKSGDFVNVNGVKYKVK